MADVARAAGTSKMAVSLALRNHSSLPAATIQRIQALAESMGYRPSPVLSALMTELRASRIKPSTATIAYVTSALPSHTWMQSATHRKFYTGAIQRAEALGYRMETFNLAREGVNTARLARILWHRNIRGVIFAPTPNFTLDLQFDFSQFSTVAIGFSIAGVKIHRVSNHHTHTTNLALRNLLACGYRRLTVVMHERDNPRVDHGWIGGYRTFIDQHPELPVIPPLICPMDSRQEFRRWMSKWKPDGIATLDKLVPLWLSAFKYQIPEAIGIAMLSVHPEESNFSGAEQHCEVIGATAVDLVAEELNHNHLGIPVYPKTVYIESDWIAGSSTRPPASPKKQTSQSKPRTKSSVRRHPLR